MRQNQTIDAQVALAYLTGQLDTNQQREIARARRQYAAHEALFDLLDHVKQALACKEDLRDPQYVPLERDGQHQDAADAFMLRLLSGKLAEDDAYTLINELAQPSSGFFDELLYMLKQSSQPAKLGLLPRLPLVAKLFAVPQPLGLRRVLETVGADVPSKASSHPAWMGAFARIAVAAVMIFLTITAYDIVDTALFERQFRYDDKVPFDPELDAQRGVLAQIDSAARVSAEFRAIQQQHARALAFYLAQDYCGAVAEFDALIPLIPNQQTDSFKQLAAESHFYLGLSYFALARSEGWNCDLDRNTLLSVAAENLEGSRRLAQADTKLHKQATFFLALARGFDGQNAEAVELLKSLKTEEYQGVDVRELINRWSD